MLLYLGEYRALDVVILTTTLVVALGDGLAMARYGNQGWKGAGFFLSEVLLAWLLGRYAGFSI